MPVRLDRPRHVALLFLATGLGAVAVAGGAVLTDEDARVIWAGACAVMVVPAMLLLAFAHVEPRLDLCRRWPEALALAATKVAVVAVVFGPTRWGCTSRTAPLPPDPRPALGRPALRARGTGHRVQHLARRDRRARCPWSRAVRSGGAGEPGLDRRAAAVRARGLPAQGPTGRRLPRRRGQRQGGAGVGVHRRARGRTDPRLHPQLTRGDGLPVPGRPHPVDGSRARDDARPAGPEPAARH